MIDRFGKEIDFSELFMEETLSAKDKKNIPDDQWGLIIKNDKGEIVERRFPLNDETHVRQAAIFFDRAKGLSDDQKRELARNIVRRAKELDMDYSGWESLKPYLDKSVKESFMTYESLMKQNYPDPDSTSGTSDFDDSDNEPDDCYNESFEELFGPVIQEAFDAVTGEEIPINHAYTMEEMAKRTLSFDEAKAIEKDELIPIKPPKADEVYFGSPTNHMPEIDLNRPLFVSPYKGIASIFIWGDMGLQDRIPRGSYNHNYEEWISFDEKKMKNPLKEVHVYVEGAPFLEPFTVEQEGYIHCISTKDYLNNFFRKPWMSKDLEYLIAKTDNMKVEFTRSIKCKVKYYIKGRPSPKGKSYGPSKGGILEYIHKISKNIHAKYKADQKEPTGNQNCLLCAWCAEASIRGGEYLPRPVYSPRDPALEITPGDIVGGVTKKNPGNFYDMLEHLRGDSINQPFARWYCHVKWGHSNGGHEFLIVKIDEDAFNIMDPQQGVVRPLTADDSYMKNVDWEGTYFCRIDDKPFKYMEFDKINEPSKTLPWDPKKDIPYMVKHGLCTKEEAERELKHAETMEFYKVLKEELGQTPVQEGAWNDIRNGVNPWSTKRVFHISQDGHLDGQVFKPRVPEYLDKYDPSQDKFEDVENPRVCFSPSIEGCLNAIMVTIGRWKSADKLRDWYVYVPEKPLKEYKHRTNKQLVKEKKVYDANVTDEIWIEEPVRLKQYGIIRIDQVIDKHIKKTVPTTTGFTGHRYRYDFKYHWLVKPKVIADLPYDYSPEEVCKDMIADMEKYKYGLAENGTVHSASAHDYDTKYKLQSPEEFEQNGGGICYDYVEFMEGYLNAYGYDCKKYFISTNTADNDTHTFLLVRDGKGWKDGFIYPESSFKLLEGVYKVKNYEEAALKIMDKIFDVNHNGEKYDEIKYYVWEYSGHPPYGSDMKTCMEYFSKGDPIHEGTAMKIKRKD